MKCSIVCAAMACLLVGATGADPRTTRAVEALIDDLADGHLPPGIDRLVSAATAPPQSGGVIPTPGWVSSPERTERYEIHLRSRRFTPAEGVSGELVRTRGQHVMVQFYDALPDREVLSGYGVTLLGHLPHHTFQAYVPAGRLDDLARDGRIRAIVPIDPEDKISPHIRERGISPHGMTPDGLARVIVILFDDVDRAAGERLVGSYGEIVDAPPRKNLFGLHLPVERIPELALHDAVRWIEEAPAGNAELLDQSRAAVNLEPVQEAPYNLDAAGIVLAMWDAGLVYEHNDLAGRVTHGDACPFNSEHASHVSGILAGDGTESDGQYRGFATRAEVRSYEWPNDISELDSETADAILFGAILSQNSWGFVVDGTNCDSHGDYDAWSECYDEIVNGALGDEITVVCATGNEENDGDCAPYPYHQLLPPIATAKNPIAVGAVYSDTQEHTCFSSRGPTDDGRLKPDLVAPGDEANDYPENPCIFQDRILSTLLSQDYINKAGTSMSAPMVSGTVGLLRQQFDDLGYVNIPPHTYRAILAMTADDLGNPGADYTHGHGMLDVLEAVELVERHYPNEELIRWDTVVDDEILTYEMTVPPGQAQLRVALAWDDLPGDPAAAVQLVNDLDVYLVSPSATNFHAYRLDPTNPDDAAFTGWNDLDNLEVVQVDAPEPGRWQVKVWGWDIPVGSQQFTLVLPFEDIQCGDAIYHSATLGEDLDCTGDGLYIQADDVCLDCAGYAISGDMGVGDNGVEIFDRNNVQVEDCTIRRFDHGVIMLSSDSCSIGYSNDIYENETGIRIASYSNSSIVGVSWIHDNDGNGIEIDDAYNNTVALCDIYDNERGVTLLNESTGNIIGSLEAHDNRDRGIDIRLDSDYNQVGNCDVYNNPYGIILSGCGVGCEIEGNEVHDNDWGIYISETGDHYIADNAVTTNIECGISLRSTVADVALINNYVCGNAVDIEDFGANAGDRNHCSDVVNWSDEGQSYGCDWECSGCRNLEDDLQLDQDMTLCAGNYNIADEGAEGVIQSAANGVQLNGNFVTLVGDGSGTGLLCTHDRVKIENLTLNGYHHGAQLVSTSQCSLLSVHGLNSVANGIGLSNADITLLLGCEVEGNGGCGFSVANTEEATIRRCWMHGNARGLALTQSNFNYVSDNDIYENDEGIDLSDSQHNTLWDNRLYDNAAYNATEDVNSNSNAWNTTIGNNWDDFATNSGYPTHYVIDGPGDGIDWYPYGRVLLVYPDGSGDYPTIQAAIDAAAEGEIVGLMNGIYTGAGNRDLDYHGKSVWVRSESGMPDSCIINCEGLPGSNNHWGVRFDSEEDSSAVLEGVTIMNAYMETPLRGGALHIGFHCAPVIRNCVIRNNRAYEGAGMFTLAAWPLLQDCLFKQNAADTHGGAASLRESSRCVFEHVTFFGNYAEERGGAIYKSEGQQVMLRNCTFHWNRSPEASSVFVDTYSSRAAFENSLVTGGIEGAAIKCTGSGSAILICSNLYDNDGGDWIGSIASQYGLDGNISEDPLYCDAPNFDLTIQDDSPCAPFTPPNTECDLIGALPVGCTGFSTAEELDLVPRTVFLSACRPNPSMGAAQIAYGISRRAGETPVSLIVYSAAGQRICTLVDGYQAQGFYTVTWSGANDRGARMPGGVYFYRLTIDGRRFTRRVTLLN